MTNLESAIYAAGYVRCPIVANRWYPSYGGSKRVVLNVIVTEDIKLMNWMDDVIAQFADVPAFLAHVDRVGTVPEPGPMSGTKFHPNPKG